VGEALELEDKKAIDRKVNSMIIPVRCFTCGKLIGDKWEEFSQRVESGEVPFEILNKLGIKRYCCRRMLLSHTNIIDEVLRFSEVLEKRREESNY
jgi:DNA-directed RNA polymerase subunit N